MDKALEKIIKFKEDLEKLYIEKANIEDKIDFKKEEQEQLHTEQTELLKDKNKLKNTKENIEYKQANLKKWKVQKIITTLLSILIFETLIIGGSLSFLEFKPALTLSLFLSAYAIPMSISQGDINNYKENKKYLENNKLEDIENEILENNKEFEFNWKLIHKLQNELDSLLNDQKNILNNINLLESEIENLKNIRTNVIEEYLKDNQELDNLINLEYQKQKQKKLNLRKDG